MHSEESTICGYRIPAGVNIVTNYNNVMMNEQVFPDANHFNPDRFLNDKGQFVQVAENMPFGIGRRNCIAQTFARIEIFILVVMMAQRFTFVPPAGKEMKPIIIESLVRSLQQFEVIAVERRK